MLKKLVIAKAFVMNTKGLVLLVQRSETAPRRPLQWDLPGGFVDDDDESYQSACLREVLEETGLSLKNNHLELTFTESKTKYNDAQDVMTDVSWLYFTGIAKDTRVKLSYEHVAYKWASLDDAQELITYDTQLRALAYAAELKRLASA